MIKLKIYCLLIVTLIIEKILDILWDLKEYKNIHFCVDNLYDFFVNIGFKIYNLINKLAEGLE